MRVVGEGMGGAGEGRGCGTEGMGGVWIGVYAEWLDGGRQLGRLCGASKRESDE